MKEYKFYVILCGGYCGGEMTIKAENSDEAYDKAMDDIGQKLYKTFPDLDIDYDVEIDESESE